jgi:hypothetical protein
MTNERERLRGVEDVAVRWLLDLICKPCLDIDRHVPATWWSDHDCHHVCDAHALRARRFSEIRDESTGFRRLLIRAIGGWTEPLPEDHPEPREWMLRHLKNPELGRSFGEIGTITIDNRSWIIILNSEYTIAVANDPDELFCHIDNRILTACIKHHLMPENPVEVSFGALKTWAGDPLPIDEDGLADEVRYGFVLGVSFNRRLLAEAIRHLHASRVHIGVSDRLLRIHAPDWRVAIMGCAILESAYAKNPNLDAEIPRFPEGADGQA